MNICISFSRRALFPHLSTPDEDEFIETIPTKFSSAQELLKTGEIIDAKTALGIILAENFFQQKQVP